MIWTWRHWVLIYSMSLPLWDLCWSFALVALTDYLKAALAGLCWTSWYVLPPPQGVSGLLKPLFFFRLTSCHQHTRCPHCQRLCQTPCLHGLRVSPPSELAVVESIERKQGYCCCKQATAAGGDTWDYHNHDNCPQIIITPNRAAFVLCVSPCLWLLLLLFILHCPFHPLHLMQSVYWGKVSGLRFCSSVYSGGLLALQASPKLVVTKGTLSFVGVNLQVDHYMSTASMAARTIPLLWII